MQQIYEIGEEVITAKNPPTRHKYGIVVSALKCGGCNWEVGALYAVADSQEEADRLYREEDIGMCCECMTKMLVENGSQVIR